MTMRAKSNSKARRLVLLKCTNPKCGYSEEVATSEKRPITDWKCPSCKKEMIED